MTGEILRLIKTNHIDCVKSHSVFIQDSDPNQSYRIFDDLEAVTIADKKVILHYPNCYAEITQI